MARLSLLTFLALAFSNVASAAPQDLGAASGLRARDGNQDYTHCFSDPDIVSSLNVSPNPAKPGDTIVVYIGVEAYETVVEGTSAIVTVLYGRDVLSTRQIDVCQGNCAIKPGPYKFQYSVTLPEYKIPIPSIELSIKTEGYSPEARPRFCFTFRPTW